MKARLTQWVEAFWWRKKAPPIWMRPLAHGYGWISRRHMAARERAAVVPPLPLVSVGNITVGGSGKTPFVLALAHGMVQRGVKPVIVCRGDGGQAGVPALVPEDGDPLRFGDEAVMMAQAGVAPVIAGKDRLAAAEMAAGVGDVMLLDDGFQYRQILREPGRSCDVVLLPVEGVGNGALLPIGPLREPCSGLKRASVVVVSGVEAGAPAPPLLHDVPEEKVFFWNAPLSALEEGIRGDDEVVAYPKQVLLVTAIARPERVVSSLESLGVEVVEHRVFPDHYCYRALDVARLCAQRLPVVTTMKDVVKLRRLWPLSRSLWVCRQRLTVCDALMARILRDCGLARSGEMATLT